MGLIYSLVVRQKWPVLSCYGFGWFKLLSDVQLIKKLWINLAETPWMHVHDSWLLAVPYAFGSVDRPDLLFYFCVIAPKELKWLVKRQYICFWSHVESYLSGCALPNVFFASSLHDISYHRSKSNRSVISSKSFKHAYTYVWVISAARALTHLHQGHTRQTVVCHHACVCLSWLMVICQSRPHYISENQTSACQTTM